MGQGGEGVNQVAADDDADDGDDRETGAVEFARCFRVFAAHVPETDEVQEEDGEDTCIRQFDDVHQRYEAGDDGNRYGADDRDQVWRMVFRMDLADACRQETVAGDGEEDARLTEEIDDERRDDAGNGADGDEIGHARPVEDTQGMGDRFRRIQVRIVDGTGQGEGHGDVEAHTDEDRKNDANRQVAFRFLTFFSRCGDGVEAHVREEDNGRTAQDTLDAEGCEGVEVGHFHMRCGDADEGDDGGQGDEDQGRIQFSTLFCPADQDQGQQEDDDDCRKIDDASFSRGL